MALPRNLTAKIYNIKAHDGKVTSLDLGETGSVLVTGGEDRNVNLWAIGQKECFMSLSGHNRPIECVRFAYNDDFVYSADDIGIIRRWDLNAQSVSSTLNGHMKSVRTLDFNPSGEYVVSGSNDTTVRLWDLQNDNKCIKTYRGHISQVNSVKFSPDGLWIASAGSEGSVVIWDIRKSRQIMDFTDETPTASITCIQFHPFEFLLAVGRNNGTVSIYDLENQVRISRTEKTIQPFGIPISCITFSENGDCLFAGTSMGISVIGWEPDREFDNIKSTWSTLADMKIVNKKLICGCFENDNVSVNAVSIDRVIPFYNPSNTLPSFNHNSTNRKSFSRGNHKFCLSINDVKPSHLIEKPEDKNPIFAESNPLKYKLELVDESLTNTLEDPINDVISATSNPLVKTSFNITQRQNKITQHYNVAPFNNGFDGKLGSLGSFNYNGPSSLQEPENHDGYNSERDFELYADEMDYLNDSNPPIVTNYENSEMVEDFPVNQNLRHPHSDLSTTSNVAPTKYTNLSSKGSKKSSFNTQKRGTHLSGGKQNYVNNKLGQVSSISSLELHKLDDNMILKKSTSTHLPNKRNTSQTQVNKENTRGKNITVQIITKPMRSRTSLDMRSMYSTRTHERHTPAALNYRPDLIPTSSKNINRNTLEDQFDLQVLSTTHEHISQELSNRNASLQLLRNLTRSNDLIGALKQTTQMCGRSVFVDLLGAILEKPSNWNLDLCLFILPEIYELLQSQIKFHYTRACDTLRVILSNFLPVIQENLDPWAINELGVDVTRENRQRKCLECQRWLLQIRSLPETNNFGTTLTQLKQMITV